MVLEDRRRQPVTGTADCQPIPAAVTTLKAVAFVVGFGLLGVGAAVVPPHLPQLVVLPSIGLFLAVHTWGQRARVGALRWTCPSCGADAALPSEGRVWGPDHWARCPACSEPVRVVLQDG